MSFLQADGEPDYLRTPSSCVLCGLGEGGKGEFDEKNYVLFRGETCYVVLNVYPYAAGHMMVVPYVHEGDLVNLDEPVVNEMMSLSRLGIQYLKEIYDPEGFNFGANLGRAGGAAFGEHAHFHVVPRWLGDTNFMTTLAHARVIPEALQDTYDRIRARFQAE